MKTKQEKKEAFEMLTYLSKNGIRLSFTCPKCTKRIRTTSDPVCRCGHLNHELKGKLISKKKKVQPFIDCLKAKFPASYGKPKINAT